MTLSNISKRFRNVKDMPCNFATNRSGDVIKRILCTLGSKDMPTICRNPVTIRKTKRVESYHVFQNDPFRRPFGASPGTSPEHPSGAATEPLGSWYGAGAEPVRSRYRAGTELVRHRYGAAMEPVRGWYAGSAGTEAQLLQSRYGAGRAGTEPVQSRYGTTTEPVRSR